MKKVWILGGNGMLGTWLYGEYAKQGFSPLSIGRSDKNDICIQLQIDQNRFDQLISDHQKPDFIINTVAIANVDYCEKNISESFFVNADFVKKLSAFAKNWSIPFIHISTDHSYVSGQAKEDNVFPVNVYAMTKLLGDLFAKENHAVVLRTNFYGKSLVNKESFSDWVVKSFKSNQNFNLFTDNMVSFCHWTSLFDGIRSVMNSYQPGIYNFGTIDSYSKAEFSIQLARQLGIYRDGYQRVESKQLSQSVQRPINMSMNVDLFNQTFKFNGLLMESEIQKAIKEYL